VKKLEQQDTEKKQICMMARTNMKCAEFWANRVADRDDSIMPDPVISHRRNSHKLPEHTEICSLPGISYFNAAVKIRQETPKPINNGF
jgi:hypothetical protein